MEYVAQLIIATLVLLVDIKILVDSALLVWNPSWTWWTMKKRFYANHATKLAFLVALTSMAGSLFFSEALGWTPCNLCWWQRIFMYSSVFVLGWSWYQREAEVGLRYASLLSVPGALVAAYHVALHQFERFVPAACGAGEVSCAASYTFWYGYITIPMMALTGFLAILGLYWAKTVYDAED
jgi:disulfide bond formation protein DsbB